MDKAQREALKRLDGIRDSIARLMKEGEKIADKANVRFSLDVVYGMGGTYYPREMQKKFPEGELRNGWMPSAYTC